MTVNLNANPSSYYCTDIRQMRRIKLAILDAHDLLVEEGLVPSIRRILEKIPFKANERLVFELRSQLLDSGDLDSVPRGGRSGQEADCNVNEYVPQKEVDKRALAIRKKNEEEMLDIQGKGERSRTRVLTITEWSRKRYRAAWKSVESILRKTRDEATQRKLDGKLAVMLAAMADVLWWNPES